MKIAALFLFVTCLTGSAAYVAATALGGNPVHAQRVPAATDSTPTAAEFAQALVQGTNQFGDGDPIANAHCAKGAPGRYMCSYAVVKATGRECHLMQGRWTPDLPSTITVTLAGRVRRCNSLRAAVHSLD